MVKKVLSVLALALMMAVVGQLRTIPTAEAAEVWAYGNVYVLTDTVRITNDYTIKCRTKTVNGMSYDITGWEFAKDDFDNIYYRVCESHSKRGLVAVEGTWYDLTQDMAAVLTICADYL